ncbi:hypothetical protein CAL19_12820 [Bordetella genomosp. 7]|uniref:Uncharacterized protein n=1 Tax=Bordetella genomosp. 7 TaxID=1416805 RepID=A0A261QYZ7_9BORD|nr:hypothetical protein CAL19_12820 [Bordetella genomosp. 7]
MTRYAATLYTALGLAVGTLGGGTVMHYQKPDKVTLYMPDWTCTVNVATDRLQCERKTAGTL